MKGEWKTRNGLYAKVDKEAMLEFDEVKEHILIGYVKFHDLSGKEIQLQTWWDAGGNCRCNPDFDLMTRKRGDETF